MSTLRLVPPGGAPIDVASDRALIGRDPGVDIMVNDPSVSRRHALLERRPEGWVVVDQRSANGTFVNEQRVEQAVLQNGLQLRLGAVNFSVVLPAGAVTGPMAVPPQPGYPPQPQPYGAPAYPPQPAPGYPPSPAYPPPQPAYAPPQPAARPGVPNYPSTIPPPGYAPAAPGPASVYGSPPAPGYPPAAPGYPPAGAPGPAAPPRAPAAAPLPGGMSEAEAAEILGLWPGSPPDEVRRRYQKLYNDFQIRLTNAPTPSLKKMYQKNIQDLKMACDVICPGSVA